MSSTRSSDLEPSTSGGDEDSTSNASQEAEDILTMASRIAASRKLSGKSTKIEERLSRSRSRSITPLDDEEDEDNASEASTPLAGRSRSPSQSLTRRGQRAGGPLKVMTAENVSNVLINIVSLITCVLIFGIFLVGSYDYFKNVEENKCAMTYMYQVPLYVPLTIGSGMEEKYPMYHLYAYVEGERAFEVTSRENFRFTGIPVLFIPGNAGSYQQVRSLASVALWKYIDAGTPFHFDFFTVDLNEEFSALYGYSLPRQVEFTKQALAKIVSLYDEFHRVVLVGHSMGGVVAKAVALDDHGDTGAALSNFIITLATPHHNPVAILDPEIDLFYHSVKKNWTKLRDSEGPTASTEMTLVSIAGGDRDYLVLPKLTRWPSFTNILAKTTGIPGVWASTDHLCIVWCKQLVMTIIRTMYDLVEFHQRNKYYVISENSATRQSILDYHFKQRIGGKSYHTSPKSLSPITLSKSSVDQLEISSGMHCTSGGQRSAYILFPMSFLLKNVTEDAEDSRLIVMTTNTRDRNWIMGCTVFKAGLCVEAENLAFMGNIVPHLRRRRKMATIPLSGKFLKYSHLVVKMDSYSVKTCVMLETFSESQRQLPLIGSQFTATDKIFYNLTLSRPLNSESTLGGLISNLMAWKVEVTPAGNNGSCTESHNLLATFHHGDFEQNRFLKNESLIVRYSDWNTTSAWVALYLEPTCSYNVRVTLAPLETAGQFFRLLIKFLPSFFASIVLMTLYYQEDPVNWSSFHILLLSNAYRLAVFPGFIIAVALHAMPTDWPHMIEPMEYSVILPILLYMTAYCLVLAVSSGTWYTIITGGTALHSVIVRVLSTRFGSWVPRLLSNHRGFTSVTEHVTEAAFEMTLTRFPLTIAVVLLALSFATCGSLSIALCVAIYLVKLFKIYEDLLEDLLKAKIANIKDSLTPMNFHFSSFMLWFVIGLLNLPSLLHWTRSPSVSVTANPQWDLSMYLCLLLLPTVAILWQDFVPSIDANLWKVHRYIFLFMGFACVLWGTHRLYVTAFIIVFVFLTLATCQLLTAMINSMTKNSPPPDTASNSESAPNTNSASPLNEPSMKHVHSETQEMPSTSKGQNFAQEKTASCSASKEDLEEDPSAADGWKQESSKEDLEKEEPSSS